MLRIWNVFADVKTAEDLHLPTPELAERPDGQRLPHTVLIPGQPELRAYVHDLGERAERVRGGAVAPEEDNMLKISTDGRKAALDMRLINGQPTTGQCKLDVAAATIADVYHQHRHRTYSDPGTGQRSPTPGALQIVFCDLSTPSSQDWNAYRELRDQLANLGVPAEQVRFIHEARNDAEKARLFAACRTGQVAVIVGSTAKMGVGTNIQHRAIALHHLDCPWRPADIEQREGRALRQGNQNPEIQIYRYAVEGSFDAYSWQTVERKARFINQITRGRLDARQVDDVGENALSFAEVKALASGDPLILDKARADADHARLSRLHRAWQRSQQTLRHTLAASTDQADDYAQRASAVTVAIARRQETRGDAFHMTVDGQSADTRLLAAELLARWPTINQHAAATGPLPLGELAGLELDARVRYDPTDGHRKLTITLRDVPCLPRRAAAERAHARRQPGDPPARASRPGPPSTRTAARRPPARRAQRSRRRPPRAHPAVQIRRRARPSSRHTSRDHPAHQGPPRTRHVA